MLIPPSLTTAVCNEALELPSCGVILAYHPPVRLNPVQPRCIPPISIPFVVGPSIEVHRADIPDFPRSQIVHDGRSHPIFPPQAFCEGDQRLQSAYISRRHTERYQHMVRSSAAGRFSVRLALCPFASLGSDI